jgi:hypothetical protein
LVGGILDVEKNVEERSTIDPADLDEAASSFLSL